MSQFHLSAVTGWYTPLHSSHSYFQRGGNWDLLLLKTTAGLHESLVFSWNTFAFLFFAFFCSFFNPFLFIVLCSIFEQDLQPPSQHCYGDHTEFGRTLCFPMKFHIHSPATLVTLPTFWRSSPSKSQGLTLALLLFLCWPTFLDNSQSSRSLLLQCNAGGDTKHN